MFRVEFFCEDKNLPESFRRLTGIALDVPKAFPVVNATVNGTGKKKTIKAKSGGTTVELFAQHLHENGITNVKVPDIRNFLASVGHSRKSANTLIARAIEAGVISKAKGFRAGYNVR